MRLPLAFARERLDLDIADDRVISPPRPALPTLANGTAAIRVALCIEWTRPPAYAAVAQSALNKLKTARIHWVDPHTGRYIGAEDKRIDGKVAGN